MIKIIRTPPDEDDESVLRIPDHLIPLVEARAAKLGVLPGIAAAEMIARGLVAFGQTLSPEVVDFLKARGLSVPRRDPSHPLAPDVVDFIEANRRPGPTEPKRVPKKLGLH
jgi:hypothetical protein